VEFIVFSSETILTMAGIAAGTPAGHCQQRPQRV